MAPPALGNGDIAQAPFACFEGNQRVFGSLGIDGAINSLRSVANGLRSFHDTKSMLLRSKWTMHVWTMASGNTAVIASGKPLRPSTTASMISSVPRFLSSFITRSQNLAPSFCSIHRPRTSLRPSARTPSAMWIALLRTMPSSRILTRMASKNTNG